MVAQCCPWALVDAEADLDWYRGSERDVSVSFGMLAIVPTISKHLNIEAVKPQSFFIKHQQLLLLVLFATSRLFSYTMQKSISDNVRVGKILVFVGPDTLQRFPWSDVLDPLH